ncbi:hypothetical protein HK099_008559 [Clydaea vesicula]|uniref:Uncharacterized protein n=1 Tax=Clydaea vesicula TaxID=447962 RepID=A0AAD5XXV8_9FUNG|nr:hypothetical protein HK099_008559 [Clydaea vesicula]
MRIKDQKIISTVEELDLLQFHNKNLIKKIESLQQEVKKNFLPVSLSKSNSQKNTNFSNPNTILQQELSGKILENEKLQNYIFDFSNENKELKSNLIQFEHENNSLKSSLEKFEKDNENLRNQVKTKNLKIEEFQRIENQLKKKNQDGNLLKNDNLNEIIVEEEEKSLQILNKSINQFYKAISSLLSFKNLVKEEFNLDIRQSDQKLNFFSDLDHTISEATLKNLKEISITFDNFLLSFKTFFEKEEKKFNDNPNQDLAMELEKCNFLLNLMIKDLESFNFYFKNILEWMELKVNSVKKKIHRDDDEVDNIPQEQKEELNFVNFHIVYYVSKLNLSMKGLYRHALVYISLKAENEEDLHKIIKSNKILNCLQSAFIEEEENKSEIKEEVISNLIKTRSLTFETIKSRDENIFKTLKLIKIYLKFFFKEDELNLLEYYRLLNLNFKNFKALKKFNVDIIHQLKILKNTTKSETSNNLNEQKDDILKKKLTNVTVTKKVDSQIQTDEVDDDDIDDEEEISEKQQNRSVTCKSIEIQTEEYISNDDICVDNDTSLYGNSVSEIRLNQLLLKVQELDSFLIKNNLKL